MSNVTVSGKAVAAGTSATSTGTGVNSSSDSGSDSGSGSGTNSNTDVAVTSISINKITTMDVGGHGTVTATVLPSNATDKTVMFSSSDKSVATIDAAGTIYALAVGSVTITATCGGKSDSFIMVVRVPENTALATLISALTKDPLTVTSAMLNDVIGTDDANYTGDANYYARMLATYYQNNHSLDVDTVYNCVVGMNTLKDAGDPLAALATTIIVPTPEVNTIFDYAGAFAYLQNYLQTSTTYAAPDGYTIAGVDPDGFFAATSEKAGSYDCDYYVYATIVGIDTQWEAGSFHFDIPQLPS
ncbi:hypothetical protein SDC9_143810 [bioreactor metagenome]|uniref:BIG2 domain-containing protein n=1 Tax=bioreactor metagenome TaxID=1076179 RepID=A0A645E560_9ZZZZ